MLPDMELIGLQTEALFRHDASGRMLSTNEPEPDPAPRLFLGRTKAGSIWRFRYDLPAPLIRDLERVLRAEPVAADLGQPPATLAGLIETLEAHAPVQSTWIGPAWRFPDEVEPPEGAVAITSSNVAVLRRHFPYTATYLEDRRPCAAVVVDGVAVSACYSARNSPEAAEAGVDTLEAFRGRGYAPAVVAAWGIAVRESGRVPLYSTSWENLASRSVARKLGLVLYGADLSIS